MKTRKDIYNDVKMVDSSEKRRLMTSMLLFALLPILYVLIFIRPMIQMTFTAMLSGMDAESAVKAVGFSLIQTVMTLGVYVVTFILATMLLFVIRSLVKKSIEIEALNIVDKKEGRTIKDALTNYKGMSVKLLLANFAIFLVTFILGRIEILSLVFGIIIIIINMAAMFTYLDIYDKKDIGLIKNFKNSFKVLRKQFVNLILGILRYNIPVILMTILMIMATPAFIVSMGIANGLKVFYIMVFILYMLSLYRDVNLSLYNAFLYREYDIQQPDGFINEVLYGKKDKEDINTDTNVDNKAEDVIDEVLNGKDSKPKTAKEVVEMAEKGLIEDEFIKGEGYN